MISPILSSAPHNDPYISIISAMITPVFLIVATGALINATLSRLTRVTDRSRELIENLRTPNLDPELRASAISHLRSQQRRSLFVERALVLLYIAIGCFVAGSISIGLYSLNPALVPWLPLVFVLLGTLALFSASLFLFLEITTAAYTIRDEIAQVLKENELRDPGGPVAKPPI